MLKFSGITQVQEVVSTIEGRLYNITIFNVVHSRQGKIKYEGTDPFDCFRVSLRTNNKKDSDQVLLDLIKPGTILSIEGGRMLSNQRVSRGTRWWNIVLVTEPTDVTILGQSEPPPSFEEHLGSTGDNGKEHS